MYNSRQFGRNPAPEPTYCWSYTRPLEGSSIRFLRASDFSTCTARTMAVQNRRHVLLGQWIAVEELWNRIVVNQWMEYRMSWTTSMQQTMTRATVPFRVRLKNDCLWLSSEMDKMRRNSTCRSYSRVSIISGGP
jgi:hypothetical protein